MGRGGNWVAGALVGAAASTGAQAQDGTTSPAPAPVVANQTAPADPASAAPAAPRRMEFRGADGKPLPPDIQKQLEERFKNDPPPATTRPLGAPGAEGGDVVVRGQRPRGSVIGDIPPERSFSPLDIRAYGANDIGELLQALGPQVSSNRGREDSGPIVLVNGKRVSSFAEIARIPPEAIERMDIFPEELALKYGYRADQKVVNVVVFERFSSRVGELRYTLPTEGGRDTAGVSANYLRIRGNTRFNFNADYNRSDTLFESERGVVQAAGTPNLGQFRTLLPATDRLALNGAVSGTVLGDVSATLNGRFESVDSRSLLGVSAVGAALVRDTDTRVAHFGTALGGAMGTWQWSFTGNYDRITTQIFTDTAAAGAARDEARSVNALANAEVVVSGAVAELPTGPLMLSARGGLETRDFSSRSIRSGTTQTVDLSRDRGTVQANLDLPIANRQKNALPWLGNLSLNANVEVEDLSDFGTLRTLGYGVYWSPIDALSIIASATDEEGAPTVDQLGAPTILTPNVRTYDFVRGEVVDITRVSGGNAGLRADDRHIVRLGINAKPFAKRDLTFSIDYTNTRIDDPIAAFPIATSEVEAAFPDRFTRDAAGRLLRIDGRPLNFARSDQEKLRWGINFTRPLGAQPPGMNANIRFGAPVSEAELLRRYPGAKIIRAEPGSPMARRAEGMMSRLMLSLYHTVYLQDEILVRNGGPVLDLLDGSATGARGGRPRHEFEFQAGAFKRGLGARLTANWQSGTEVRGLPPAPGAAAGDLSFSNYATVSLNLFANLADRLGGAKAPKWVKGTRVSLGIDNLFNDRPDVRDATGAVPLNYQPAYLDPLGRSVTFSLRKVF